MAPDTAGAELITSKFVTPVHERGRQTVFTTKKTAAASHFRRTSKGNKSLIL
jgi:hypothetical protein